MPNVGKEIVLQFKNGLYAMRRVNGTHALTDFANATRFETMKEVRAAKKACLKLSKCKECRHINLRDSYGKGI